MNSQVEQVTTVEFVRDWIMSGDHEVSDWERKFAAAIDARSTAPPSLASQPPVLDEREGATLSPDPVLLGEVREALDDLQQAESEYRLMHDRHGDDSRASGRAWDLMRRAGDKSRALLAKLPKLTGESS